MKKFTLILVMLLLSFEANADSLTNFVKIDCDNELGYLSIYPFSVHGNRAEDILEKNDRAAENKGMINISSLIHSAPKESINVYDFETYHDICKLNDKNYEIEIQGSYISKGNCTQFESFQVTIKSGKQILTDKLLFSLCGKRNLSRLDVIDNDEKGYNEIDIWDSSIAVTRYFFDDKDFKPLTTEMIHGSEWTDL